MAVNQANLVRAWHLFDAKNLPVGRVATRIAKLLMGKHKPTYVQRSVCGDHVVVVNCEKVVLSGKKWEQKLYRHHSGHPGGLKEIPAWRMRDEHPERILFRAVSGMLPKNRLRNERLKLLDIVVGNKHRHGDKLPQV